MDYLTSADYNGGLANENPSWSYDAAGNRNDVTAVDNLNRATTISGVSRTYDILGNTLTKGSTTTYTWDVLNRMLSHTANSVTTDYAYRADGMRVTKDNGTTLSKFYYDGQMPTETTEITSSATVVTRNGLGARGIDRIERVGTSTTVGYPMYDTHGNMIATIAKSGSSYSVGDLRSYDAWGGIRSGNTTGDPKSRHCATLGHVADDESALIYMRARYYDPAIGRFLIEDPERAKSNWYIYCSNNSVSLSDKSGGSEESDSPVNWFAAGSAFSAAGVLFSYLTCQLVIQKVGATGQVIMSVVSASLSLGSLYCMLRGFGSSASEAKAMLMALGAFGGTVATALLVNFKKMIDGLGTLSRINGYVGMAAAITCSSYLTAITGALICAEFGE